MSESNMPADKPDGPSSPGVTEPLMDKKPEDSNKDEEMKDMAGQPYLKPDETWKKLVVIIILASMLIGAIIIGGAIGGTKAQQCKSPDWYAQNKVPAP